MSVLWRHLVFFFTPGILLFSFAGCVSVIDPSSQLKEPEGIRVVSAEPDRLYNRLFSAEPKGWLGGDGICSIPLSENRTVWLFGDTLIGRIENRTRQMDYFVNNSIAIETRNDDGGRMVNFYWSYSDGKSHSFFQHQPGTSGTFYWPVSGVLIDGELFVFCYPIDMNADHPFALSDTTVIRISNPHEHPILWKQEAYDLGLGNGSQGFLSACVDEGAYLYFLGYDDTEARDNARRMVLARAEKSRFKSGGRREVFEFWVQGPNGPAWAPDPVNLVSLFEPGLTETMPHYDADLGLYIMPCKMDGGPSIQIRTAPALTGPWSDPIHVYDVPEHAVSFPIMSYAVKAHPELSRKPGEVVLSYATNMAIDTLEPLFTPEGFDIYIPRFIRVQLQRGGSAVASAR